MANHLPYYKLNENQKHDLISKVREIIFSYGIDNVMEAIQEQYPKDYSDFIHDEIIAIEEANRQESDDSASYYG